MWRDDRWLGAPIDDADEAVLADLPPLPEMLVKRWKIEPHEAGSDGREDEGDDTDLL